MQVDLWIVADEHIRVLLISIKTDWIACADPETVSGGGGGSEKYVFAGGGARCLIIALFLLCKYNKFSVSRGEEGGITPAPDTRHPL